MWTRYADPATTAEPSESARAILPYPAALDYDLAAVQPVIYFLFPYYYTGHDVVLKHGWLLTGQTVSDATWRYTVLSGYDAERLHRLVLAPFSFRNGETGVYVIVREIAHPADTEPEEQAVILMGLEFWFAPEEQEVGAA